MSGSRTIAQRHADVLAALERQGDAWLATASPGGSPHLIAVSAAWDGSTVTIATRSGSPTAGNLASTGRARLALGSPDDVVMLDVEVMEEAAATPDAPAGRAFTAAMGWDPAELGTDWAYYRLRPVRIQVYRGYGELEGRDVMRDGAWLG